MHVENCDRWPEGGQRRGSRVMRISSPTRKTEAGFFNSGRPTTRQGSSGGDRPSGSTLHDADLALQAPLASLRAGESVSFRGMDPHGGGGGGGGPFPGRRGDSGDRVRGGISTRAYRRNGGFRRTGPGSDGILVPPADPRSASPGRGRLARGGRGGAHPWEARGFAFGEMGRGRRGRKGAPPGGRAFYALAQNPPPSRPIGHHPKGFPLLERASRGRRGPVHQGGSVR